MPVRFWVALWVFAFTAVMLAFEGVYIIKYVTRFTEEIFAFLISCVFLSDAFRKIYKIFRLDPILQPDDYCKLMMHTTNGSSRSTSATDFVITSSSSSSSSSSFVLHNATYTGSDAAASSFYCQIYSIDLVEKSDHKASPNIALLSLILLTGTCAVALALKKLRRSVFFGAYVRRTLSDVGILITIILMVFVDSWIEQNTGLRTQVSVHTMTTLINNKAKHIMMFDNFAWIRRNWIYRSRTWCRRGRATGSCHRLASTLPTGYR